MNTLDHNQTHLSKFYLTLDQLVETSGSSSERIMELIETQCVPPHSYEVTHITQFIDPISSYLTTSHIKYYHPDVSEWIKRANELARHNSLSEVAKIVRARFNEEYRRIIGDAVTPGCKSLDDTWRALMKGIWGVCLQKISVAFIAKKELSRLKVSELVEEKQNHNLTEAEKIELKKAIDDYNSAAKEFIPYFAKQSSRYKEIEPACDKYLGL